MSKAQKPGCGRQCGCPVYCRICLYSGSTLLWIWESVTFCHTWHESGKSGVRIKKALRIVAYRYTMKTKDI
jgi:hypothetical protein